MCIYIFVYAHVYMYYQYARRTLLNRNWRKYPSLFKCNQNGLHVPYTLSYLLSSLPCRLIRYTGNQYNSCFLNLYRNGYDHVGWMSENHPALRDEPSIAVVSLGQFSMKSVLSVFCDRDEEFFLITSPLLSVFGISFFFSLI